MDQGVAERRIHTLWLNFKGYADKVLAVLIGVSGTIWGLNIPEAPENPPTMWWFTSMSASAIVWFCILMFLVLLWVLAICFLQRPTYATLMRKRDAAERLSRAKAEAIESALRSMLRQLAVHCKAEGDGYRSTVYFHHDGRFVAVARDSRHPEFQKLDGGKVRHRTDQGIIGEAWLGAEAYRSGLPEPREEWEAKICLMFGYTNEQVSSFRMQSRSYAALRIEGHQGPVGVLVIESINARGVTRETIKSANGSLIRAALAEMVTAHAKFTPRIENLTDGSGKGRTTGDGNVSSRRPWKSAQADQPLLVSVEY